MANRWGKSGSSDIIFSWAPKSLRSVTVAMKLKDACSLEEKLWQTQTVLLKSGDTTLPTKIHAVKVMVFPVVMYGCESWTVKKEAPKNWCFWTVVLEKTLESPLYTKEIKPVNPKGNQFWIFIGRTDAEAKAPVVWPPDAKSQLFRKGPGAGKDWGQEKEMTEMVGWHHWLDGHEFEQAPGDEEGQGSLVCCSPWGRKESDDWVTEQHFDIKLV